IILLGSYPRMAPQCKMLTPVFHPNIAPHAICIGDHWAAGEALSDLVIRIAEMLAFQSYNLKSPLNGEAAKWVEENKHKLPLDTFDFTSLLSIGEAVGRAADGGLVASEVCANCGKAGAPGEMQVCINQHVACPNCVLTCPNCNGVVCLKCQLLPCAVCKQSVCQRCSYKCGACGHTVCVKHAGKCHVCSHGRCEECLVACESCGKNACLEHIAARKSPDGTKHYVCHKCSLVF
ncbi:MAG: ubiquitin-conjugating enzyme E2, partial [Planctomycetota bacterium]